MKANRTEKRPLGAGRVKLTVKDEALWNPFEVLAFVAAIILVFGFVLGDGNYAFASELFAPVAVTAVVVVIAQNALRWKSGQIGVLRVLRNRILK